MPIYAAAGVAHIWLVDPDLKTLEVFALQGSQWLLWQAFKETDKVAAPPFEAVSIHLSAL